MLFGFNGGKLAAYEAFTNLYNFRKDHFGCRLRHFARQICNCASSPFGIVETIDMIPAGSVKVYFEIQRRGKPAPLQAKGATPRQSVSRA
jgi:hypothetical protein